MVQLSTQVICKHLCINLNNSSSKLYLPPMNIQIKIEVGILNLGKSPCKMLEILYMHFILALGFSVGKINIMPNKNICSERLVMYFVPFRLTNQILTNKIV